MTTDEELAQLDLVYQAVMNGYRFCESKQITGDIVFVGSLPDGDMAIYSNQESVQHGTDAVSEFFVWAFTYDGPTEAFHDEFKKRAEFIMVVMSGINPTKEEKEENG